VSLFLAPSPLAGFVPPVPLRAPVPLAPLPFAPPGPPPAPIPTPFGPIPRDGPTFAEDLERVLDGLRRLWDWAERNFWPPRPGEGDNWQEVPNPLGNTSCRVIGRTRNGSLVLNRCDTGASQNTSPGEWNDFNVFTTQVTSLRLYGYYKTRTRICSGSDGPNQKVGFDFVRNGSSVSTGVVNSFPNPVRLGSARGTDFFEAEITSISWGGTAGVAPPQEFAPPQRRSPPRAPPPLPLPPPAPAPGPGSPGERPRPLAPPGTAPAPVPAGDPLPIPGPNPGNPPVPSRTPGPLPLTAPRPVTAPVVPRPQVNPATAPVPGTTGVPQVPRQPPSVAAPPAVTPRDSTFLPGGVELPNNGPRPDLGNIATEVGKLENKLERLLSRGTGEGGTGDLGNLLELMNEALELLRFLESIFGVEFPAGSYELFPVCDRDAQGQLRPPRVASWEGGAGEGLQLSRKLDALAELIQHHKELRQPVCRTKPVGQEVTVTFEEVLP